MNHKILTTTLLVSATLSLSAQAATIYTANRASLDAIVGERDVDSPALGYYDGAVGVTNTTVGMTGSNNARYGSDLVYRYTLPTLNPGETIESFSFIFNITAFRNHINDATGFGLDLYLLDTADPTSSGTSLFLRSATDPGSNALVGAMDPLDNEGNSGTISGLDIDVSYTINSGSALALLQSFYGGDHIPDQTEASFRFNLDRAYTGGIRNQSLNRYTINNDVNTSSFELTAVPEPSAALLGSLGLLALLRRRRS